jgi:outer membrane beta-barrel protein
MTTRPAHLRLAARPGAARALAAAHAVLLAALVLAAPAPARAQSQADAFAGKIPPVSGQLYRKKGRLEATLTGNLSLNDAFFSKYFGGLKLGYHLTEFLSVSVHGASGTATKTGSTVLCSANAGCRDATDAQLWQVPGEIAWLAGVEVAWAPVYGKLNVLSEQVAHFDLSLIVGADWIARSEVLGRVAAAELETAGGTPGTTAGPGAHVGLGARLFLSEWIALRLEVKDYLYVADVPNNGGEGFQNQLFTEIGLSFFLPGRNRPVR